MTRKELSCQKIKLVKLLSTFFFSFLFLFLSCQSKNEKRLVGLWALELDSCIVSNRDWHYCSNSLIISGDKTCKLPIICTQKDNQAQGTWLLVTSKNVSDSILFNVPDNPLRGQYKIIFYKDYNVMKFKMRLTNDSTLLICSKSVLSFTSNPKDLLDKQ